MGEDIRASAHELQEEIRDMIDVQNFQPLEEFPFENSALTIRIRRDCCFVFVFEEEGKIKEIIVSLQNLERELWDQYIKFCFIGRMNDTDKEQALSVHFNELKELNRRKIHNALALSCAQYIQGKTGLLFGEKIDSVDSIHAYRMIIEMVTGYNYSIIKRRYDRQFNL